MEQQYMTTLLDAYRRGYEERYKGKEDAPEMKEHYFKVKDDLPRVQVVLGFLRGIVLAGQCQTLLERNRSREDAVPQSVIEEMMGKMTLPETSEARKVEWVVV